MPVTHRDQKWAPDLLELELHVAMSCHVRAQEPNPGLKLKCSSLLAHLSIPSILLFKMGSLPEPDTYQFSYTCMNDEQAASCCLASLTLK